MRSWRLIGGLLAVASAVSAGTVASTGDAGAATVPVVTMLATFHGDLARTGYEPLERTIKQSNVSQMVPSWTYKAAELISTEPTLTGGLAFWGDWAGYEHATDSLGHALWSTDLGQTAASSCGQAPVGVASSATVGMVGDKERVWTGSGDGTVVSLVAKTGRIIWHTRVAPRAGGFVWSSPVLYDGSIYVGVSSVDDCPLVRGRVVRIDALTGATLGTFYTIRTSSAARR